MARLALTPIQVVPGGVVASTTAGTIDGHSFQNSGQEILVVRNTGAGSHTVTVQTPQVVEGLAVTELTNAVAAGATEYMGPFNPSTFNQGSPNRGQVWIDFDATPAEVLVSVLRVEKE